MHILALIPIVIFYGAYFTKALLLRRQGIDVNRMAKGAKPHYTRTLETVLIVVTYGMAVAQCLAVFGIIPTREVNPFVGLVVSLSGCFFFIYALKAMKDSWRAGVDHTQKTELRTEGILRLSRNPAFLGFDLFYIGVAMMMPSLFLFILAAIGLIVFHLQILEEEKFLTATFGAAYLDYKNKVNRY